MKKALSILGVVVLVIVIIVAVLIANLGKTVELAVKEVVPQVTGVEVELSDVSIKLLAGKVEITGLVIKNPEGFKSKHLMAFDNFRLTMDLMSVMSDKIHIHEVILKDFDLIYEIGLGKTNIGALIDNLEGDKPAEKDEPKKEKPAEKSEKRVVIDHLRIEGTKVTLATKLTMGKGAPIVLPVVDMKDLGKDDPDGLTIAEAIVIPLNAIAKLAGDVVKGSVNLAGDGLKKGSDIAADGGKALGGAVKDAAGQGMKGLKGLLKTGE
ncbi:hypothetical protein BVX97_01830 [bacterium E08(2017)]|nr:hypothetical protein BVX97_01830 [bacterium E08(2017)]